MEVKEVVDKLIGEISPVGVLSVDEERFENLKAYCELINDMVCEIDRIAYRQRHGTAYSIKRHVAYINDFMSDSLGI